MQRSIACDKCGRVYERLHPTLPHPTPPQEEISNVAEHTHTQVKATSIACDKCGRVYER